MFFDTYKNNIQYAELKDHYSVVNEVPIYLSQSEFKQLAFEISLYLHNEKLNLKNIQSSEIKYKTTRKRIEAYKSDRLKMIKKISQSLGEMYQELDLDQVPRSNFNPYLELFFKDWLWDQKDNLSYLKDIKRGFKDTLFLGCGAARVAYEYANENPSTNVYATDSNPINLCLLYNQKNTKVFDTIIHPTNINHTSVKFEFTSPAPLKNFMPFVSDFYTMKVKQFEHVVSNWFLDILPNTLDQNLSHLINYIKDDGSFTYIGLSNFYNQSLENSFTQEEIEEILNHYFNDVQMLQKDFNYLNSSYSSQKRVEKILVIHCKGPKKSMQSIFQPDKLAINYDQKTAGKKMEYITYARFLSHVNGSVSFEEACKILEKEFAFSAEESQHYAKVMIKKVNS